MELLAVLEHSPLGCSMLQIRLTRVAVFPITVFMGPRIKDREEFIFHYCVESSTGKFFLLLATTFGFASLEDKQEFRNGTLMLSCMRRPLGTPRSSESIGKQSSLSYFLETGCPSYGSYCSDETL